MIETLIVASMIVLIVLIREAGDVLRDRRK